MYSNLPIYEQVSDYKLFPYYISISRGSKATILIGKGDSTATPIFEIYVGSSCAIINFGIFPMFGHLCNFGDEISDVYQK